MKESKAILFPGFIGQVNYDVGFIKSEQIKYSDFHLTTEARSKN